MPEMFVEQTWCNEALCFSSWSPENCLSYNFLSMSRVEINLRLSLYLQNNCLFVFNSIKMSETFFFSNAAYELQKITHRRHRNKTCRKTRNWPYSSRASIRLEESAKIIKGLLVSKCQTDITNELIHSLITWYYLVK